MKSRQEVLSKIAYYSFYIAVLAEVLIVLIDKSNYTNPIEGRLFQITFVLFLIKVCLTRYSVKEYLLIGFFLGVGAISYFTTGRNELVRVVMFIAACKEIDMQECLKRVFYVTLTGCAIIMLLAITGIYGGVVLVQDYGRGGEEIRYTLGMGHPNALQCMVLSLTLLWCYLFFEKLKWYHYVVAFLINGGFFCLTRSKTALLVGAATLVLFAIAKAIENTKLKKLFVAGNLLAFAGSIFISVMSAKDAMCLWPYYWEGVTSPKINFYAFLDKILTGRIHSLIETNNHEGIMDTWSLFSRPENNYYFDMGWVRLFYWYGIIPALLAIAILVYLLIYFVRNNKMKELIFFSVVAVYTIVEAHFVSVYIARNYLLFIIGMYWYRLSDEAKK